MTRKPFDRMGLSMAELDAQIATEQARREAEEREPQRRVDNVVAAIEAFTDAKMNYARAFTHGVRSPGLTDVRETREHLRDKLVELLSCPR